MIDDADVDPMSSAAGESPAIDDEIAALLGDSIELVASGVDSELQ